MGGLKKIYYSFNADLVELGHADPSLKKPWAQRMGEQSS